MKLQLGLLVFVASVLAGCDTYRPGAVAPLPDSRASLYEDQTPPPSAVSLFPSDQAVLGDEAVGRILATKLTLPEKAKISLVRFPDSSWGVREYGRFYWRDEQYLKLQQGQMDTLAGALKSSGMAAEVDPLPTLMTPKQTSIPTLREAALRMQADLLLVFRLNSDTYAQYRMFSKDQVKAYSTCELVLLDIRTGLVPFTRVVSREQLEKKQNGDLDLAETMRRAEEKSAVSALHDATADLVEFLKTAPKKER